MSSWVTVLPEKISVLRTRTNTHTRTHYTLSLLSNEHLIQLGIEVCVCLPGDGYSSLLACTHGNATLEVVQLAKVLPQCAAALKVPCHINCTLKHTQTHIQQVLTKTTTNSCDETFVCLLVAAAEEFHLTPITDDKPEHGSLKALSLLPRRPSNGKNLSFCDLLFISLCQKCLYFILLGNKTK